MKAVYSTKKIIDQGATSFRIREARHKKGMSLRATAEIMGISAPYLSDLELGRRAWSEKLVERFSKAVSE